jgi:hypothetical protein
LISFICASSASFALQQPSSLFAQRNRRIDVGGPSGGKVPGHEGGSQQQHRSSDERPRVHGADAVYRNRCATRVFDAARTRPSAAPASAISRVSRTIRSNESARTRRHEDPRFRGFVFRGFVCHSYASRGFRIPAIASDISVQRARSLARCFRPAAVRRYTRVRWLLADTFHSAETQSMQRKQTSMSSASSASSAFTQR